MPKLTWGDPGSRFYETGVDQGVLYVGSNAGVVWNGLVSVNEEPDGGQSQGYYYDGIKYANSSSLEEYKATLEAFTYPVEFEVCDGTAQPLAGMFVTHQKRSSFGLSYRTRIGNDLSGFDLGYKIHLVYNLLAEPTTRENTTIDDSLEANNFSWNLTSRPIAVPNGYRHTAHFVFDSRYSAPEAIQSVENILYGTEASNARMPTIEELFAIYTDAAVFVVTDLGAGGYSVSGPDILVQVLNETDYSISGPTTLYLGDDTYSISSST